MATTVIACGGASPILELGEHVLDLVVLVVGRFIIVQRLLTAFGRQHIGDGVTVCQAIAELVVVVATIGDQHGGFW